MIGGWGEFPDLHWDQQLSIDTSSLEAIEMFGDCDPPGAAPTRMADRGWDTSYCHMDLNSRCPVLIFTGTTRRVFASAQGG